MLESSKGGLSVFVNQTKKVGDVAVGICFALDANCCALNRLSGGLDCKCACFPAGSEEAAIGYALYAAVQQKLAGDPLAVAKSKVGEVHCVCSNGMFGINWKVKGNGSAVRKSVGMALSVLDPAKMFPIYSRCVKHLGGKADKEAFTYVADDTASSIKKEVTVAVVGNINMDKSKLDDIVEVLAKKHVVTAVKGSKSKPSDHTNCTHDEFTEVKVSGWHSAVLADYLESKLKGLTVVKCGKSLLVSMKKSSWEVAAKKLKKGVKVYVDAKYSKVGDDLAALFGYMTLSSAALCAHDVKKANNLSSANVESALNSNL